MRRTVWLLLGSLVCWEVGPALADPIPSDPSLTAPEPSPRAGARRDARTLEITGATLTGVGVLTEVATIALWSTLHLCFDSCSRTPAEQRRDDMQWIAASATAGIAPVLLIAGLTTWVIGAKRRKALMR